MKHTATKITQNGTDGWDYRGCFIYKNDNYVRGDAPSSKWCIDNYDIHPAYVWFTASTLDSAKQNIDFYLDD